MPHTITATEITNARHTGAAAPDAQFVSLADYTELSRAFRERTEQFAARADECIRLTNERDALRKQLARLVGAVDRAQANFADGLADEAREVLSKIAPPEIGA